MLKREVATKSLRILAYVALVLAVADGAYQHGIDVGMTHMGVIAGPALDRCIRILGGEIKKVK